MLKKSKRDLFGLFFFAFLRLICNRDPEDSTDRVSDNKDRVPDNKDWAGSSLCCR